MNFAWLYLGALYAVAVLVARRAGVDIPRRVAIFFYAAVLVFFFAPLTQRTSNIHSDILKTIPPWYYVAPDRFAANTELNDVPLQHVPWAHQVRESWKALRPPLWNHLSGSGYPLLANGQSSALSPIRLLALPLPLAQSIAAEGAMKLLIAMTFTFLFCRRRGYSITASAAGGVTFGYAGFLNTWLHFPHVTTACFLPAVLYLVDVLAERHPERSAKRGVECHPERSAERGVECHPERSAERGVECHPERSAERGVECHPERSAERGVECHPERSAERGVAGPPAETRASCSGRGSLDSLRSLGMTPRGSSPRGALIAAAIVWTFIVFGGHPETASHIFFLALLYAIWIVVVEKRASWRRFLTLGGAMTIAAMLSAPFLLPFLEALPRSQRYDALKNAPLDAQMLPYTDFFSTVVILQPHLFGRAPAERPWGPATTEPVGGFAGALAIASFFAVASHVVLRRRWRSTEAFLALSTILVFGVFQSWPLLGDLIHAVLPIVAHARFRLLFVMLLALQTAAAIELVRRGERKPLLIGTGIVAALLVAVFVTVDFPDAAKRATALSAAIPTVVVLALAALFAATRRWPLQYVVVVAAMFEVASVTRGWNPPMPRYLDYPRTPLIEELIALRKKAREPFRVAAPGAPLFPSTSAMYGLEDVRAHDPMANARYLDFLAATAKYDPWNYHAMIGDANAPVLDFLNVRYLVTDPASETPRRDRWKLVYDGPDGRIFENLRFAPRFYAVRNVIADFEPASFRKRLAALEDWRWTALVDELALEEPRMGDDFFKPRADDAPLAQATIVSADPTDYRLHAAAPRWSLVVSSIPWWPGWKIERDGKRIEPIRVNGAFLGFAVPPGTSDVRVWYSPWTWWAGVGLCAAGLLLILECGSLLPLSRARRARKAVASHRTP